MENIHYFMGSRNGQSVRDIITSGYSRKIIDINGRGQPGVSLPQEEMAQMDCAISDEIAIVRSDERDHVLEIHLK